MENCRPNYGSSVQGDVLRAYRHRASIATKLKNLLSNICKLKDNQGLDATKLFKAVHTAYDVRSKLEHSADSPRELSKFLNFGGYYLFSARIALLALLQLIGINGERIHIVEEIRQFSENPEYFHKRSAEIEKKFKHLEEMFQYFTGERKDPPEDGMELTF